MAKFLLSLLFLVVIGCASSGTDYAIKDPIFRNNSNGSEDNRIIYRANGCTDYSVKDPIFRNSGNDSKDNRILFRDPYCR